MGQGQGVDLIEPAAMEPTATDLRQVRDLVARNLRGTEDPERRRHEARATAQTILAGAVEDIAAAARCGDRDGIAAEIRWCRAVDTVRAELAGGRAIRNIDATVPA